VLVVSGSGYTVTLAKRPPKLNNPNRLLGRIPMTEKPILFSGEMVRAILEGRKTQTRRVITQQPSAKLYQYMSRNEWYEADGQEPKYHTLRKSPYGVTGDLLWVRETWAQLCEADELTGKCDVAYRADDWPEDERGPDYINGTWRPSIFMPRWASRITLEVERVRVERVQDIGDDSCEAEGVSLANASIPGYLRKRFQTLWDSINSKRGFSWSYNPWVWVVYFRLAAPQQPLAAELPLSASPSQS